MPSIPNRSFALLIIAIAIILATGVFLAISVVRGRDNAEPVTTVNNFPVLVGAEQISLQVDPNQRLTIIDTPIIDESPRVEPQPEQQVIEETATPLPQVVEGVATAVPAATAVPIPAIEKIIFIDYLVQQGETLYSISQRMDTSIALMAERGISQANLTPGQTIRLPIGNPEYCAGRGRPYAIGEGDTVFNIGQRYSTTPQNLQSINGLDGNYTIKVADIICVP